MKPQIILTWVSGSWKSSIMDDLIKDYPLNFAKPIQYTTRQPRDDKELDSYVFLTKEQFFKKMENGDFIEFTQYNWNLYAISSYINTDISNVFIVEPVGRAALKKFFHQNAVPYRWFYLEIEEIEAKNRMMNRWDTKQSIDARLEDFKYFHPEVDDKILDASIPIKRNVEYIARSVWAL